MRRLVYWPALIAAGLLAGLGLQALRVPGGLLVGPLLAGIAVATSGRVTPRPVPRWAFIVAQAAVGCLVGAAFAPATLVTLGRDIVALLGVVLSTIVAAGVTGWILARSGVLDPATAAWGASPGGASAVVLMSAEEGADARLVALQQYLRVTVVVLSAAGVARLLGGAGAHPVAALRVAADPYALPATAAVAFAGGWLGPRLRLPAGALLGPMLLGAALEATGRVHLAVPVPALVAAYLAIGLGIGLQYTRATLAYALRVLPWLFASTVLLLVLCAGSAALLVATLHVDPLSAYLATTPGGLDSVTVIALGSGSDVSIVLALQALRLVAVLLLGPAVARAVTRLATPRAASG